jgi:sigma-B regulation protein RsbU (phosphoserine phosphatase)
MMCRCQHLAGELAMMRGMQIQVYENEQLVHTSHCLGTVELGRQDAGEAPPFSLTKESGPWRFVFARNEETHFSRRHVLVEMLPGSRVRVTNLSHASPVHILAGPNLQAGQSCEVAVPLSVLFGDKRVCIQEPSSAVLATPAPSSGLMGQSMLYSLSEAAVAPGADPARQLTISDLAPAGSMSADAMVLWLQSAMSVLQSAASSSDFFDKAAAVLVDMVGLDMGQVLLLANGTWKVRAQRLARAGSAARERHASRFVLSRLLEEKKTFWQVPPAAPAATSLYGIKALVASPILNKEGNVIGALYGDRHTALGASFPSITRLEALLVELLASGVAAGMARLEQEQADLQRQKRLLQYERELDIGRQIQRGFLPATLPALPGWEIRACFQPAQKVSGDFYDVFALSEHHLAVVTADVCDKGVGAALFMALFRSLLRAFSQQALSNGPDPCTDESTNVPGPGQRLSWAAQNVLSAVQRTNRYVVENHARECMFVTLFMSVLDTRTGQLTYVNGGHDAPAVIAPAGIKSRLTPTGPAVGVMAGSTYATNSVVLEPGEILLAFTDGVVDARDPNGMPFTEKRLLPLLQGPVSSAAVLLDRVLSQVRAHIAGADQFDDITLLAVRYAGS